MFTVQLKLALPVLPAASLAETTTLYGPCCVNVETTVPLISPVPEAMLRPSGKPVAVKLNVVSSGSVAWICKLTVLPSVLVCAPGFVTTGGVVSPTFRVTVATLPASGRRSRESEAVGSQIAGRWACT